ncbi:UNVERIFIED_CONTAM: Myosin-6, partial [Sesamum angustifolium]
MLEVEADNQNHLDFYEGLVCHVFNIPIISLYILYAQNVYSLYSGDNSSAESVPPEVISSLKIFTGEDSTDAGGESFVLDDNAGIPFSIDDICSSLQETDFT